jgi:hypothetical protein
MHAVIAWALLFWFCLGYTFISSYFEQTHRWVLKIDYYETKLIKLFTFSVAPPIKYDISKNAPPLNKGESMLMLIDSIDI